MLRIGILTDQFTSWGGGVDFIRLILNGLNSINEKGQKEGMFLLPFKYYTIDMLTLFYLTHSLMQLNV